MKLSDFEIDVMQIIWQQQEAAAPRVHEEILKNKDVTYATVKTIINRLEEKGAIERSRNEGRTIYYRPLIDESSTKKPLLKSFIQRVFNNKRHELFSHMMDDESLSKDDIEYLEKILAQKKKKLEK